MAVDSVSPNRDVGVKLEWNTAGALALQGGVFNGDGVNHAANRDKRFLYMGRAVVRAAKGAYLGVSAAAKPDTTTWDAEASVERGRVAVRGEFLARHRSVAAVTTLGWYALGAYGVVPKRLQLVGRVQQFDPNDRAGTDRITGYTGALQYFFSGDDLKLQLEYTVFDEQGPSLENNRVIVQMQARGRGCGAVARAGRGARARRLGLLRAPPPRDAQRVPHRRPGGRPGRAARSERPGGRGPEHRRAARPVRIAGRSVGHAPARAAVLEARGLLEPPSRRVVPRIGAGHGRDASTRRRKARLHAHRPGYLPDVARQAAARPHGRGRFAAVQRVPRAGAQPEKRVAHQRRGRQGTGRLPGRSRDPAADRGIRQEPLRPEPVRAGCGEGTVSIGDKSVSKGGHSRMAFNKLGARTVQREPAWFLIC